MTELFTSIRFSFLQELDTIDFHACRCLPDNPAIKETGKTIRNTKKQEIFAMVVAQAVIPPNPKTAATMTMIKNIIAQYNMALLLTC